MMALHSAYQPFQLIIPVQSADIDELGHVNNIVYLRWVQEIAVAHWQTTAPSEVQTEILWVVLRHEIDYKASARLAEEVLVETWVGQASGLSFERHTKMSRASDHQLFAQARTLWCPINRRTGRPQRISAELRSQFSKRGNSEG